MNSNQTSSSNIPIDASVTGHGKTDLSWDYSPLVGDVKQLYLCKPSDALFGRLYAPDAVFEDPAGKLSPNLAFKGLAELFVPAEIEKFDVLDAADSQIRIGLKMGYNP
jgi:hypothetical protein